jgi:hypothetical protein
LSLITYHSSLFFDSSTDEMDYLQAVAFMENNLRPVRAANDLTVEFDGEAFGSEREPCYEFGKSDGSGHVPRFAIDFDKQFFQTPDSAPFQAW